MQNKYRREFILGSIAVGAYPSVLLAQTSFPTKPVKIVVPYTAGGVSDVMARMLGKGLEKIWGQPVIVDNKPGAGTVIGTQSVISSPPDGYTLLSTDRSISVNPFVLDNVPYDAQKSLRPIAMAVTGGLFLAVPGSSKLENIRELVREAKVSQRRLSYGSFGVGSFVHIDTEAVLKSLGISAVHIPYKGAIDLARAVQTGEVDFGFVANVFAINLRKSGKLKLIAYLSEKRNAFEPEVPSSSELKIPTSSSWIGIMAPAGISEDLVAKISKDIESVVNDQKFKAEFCTPMGFESTFMKSAEFKNLLAAEKIATAEAVRGLDFKKK